MPKFAIDESFVCRAREIINDLVKRSPPRYTYTIRRPFERPLSNLWSLLRTTELCRSFVPSFLIDWTGNRFQILTIPNDSFRQGKRFTWEFVAMSHELQFVCKICSRRSE